MIKIINGECRNVLKSMPDESVQCVITSPPYWMLREYGAEDNMIGKESSFMAHIRNLVDVFEEVKRVLRSDGTLWLNYGDSYVSGSMRQEKFRPKQLLMMPSRVALALQDYGWILRSEIIWHKPNPCPESVRDRPTSSHEKVFLFAKSSKYLYNVDAVRTPFKDSSLDRINQLNFDNQLGGEKDDKTKSRSHRRILENVKQKTQDKQSGYGPTRAGFNDRWKKRGHHRAHQGFETEWDNMTKEQQMENGARLRNVWQIATFPFRGYHWATFPPKLVETCMLLGSNTEQTILDPFGGSGTVGLVAAKNNRNAIIIEINDEYANLAKDRINQGDDDNMFPIVQIETMKG